MPRGIDWQNQSTSTNLSLILETIAAKESHIPYRNSKLTLQLQQALGGCAKTLMFVNVSPKENCTSETVNSLRFAAKVNACHIGTAVKNSWTILFACWAFELERNVRDCNYPFLTVV